MNPKLEGGEEREGGGEERSERGRGGEEREGGKEKE